MVVNGCHKKMHEEPTKNTWLHILNIRYIIEVITITEVIIGYYEKEWQKYIHKHTAYLLVD